MENCYPSTLLQPQTRDPLNAPAMTSDPSFILPWPMEPLFSASTYGFTSPAIPDKAAVASKSHSEAEKRRRDRINSQLTALRKLIPKSNKVWCLLRICLLFTLSMIFRSILYRWLNSEFGPFIMLNF